MLLDVIVVQYQNFLVGPGLYSLHESQSYNIIIMYIMYTCIHVHAAVLKNDDNNEHFPQN